MAIGTGFPLGGAGCSLAPPRRRHIPRCDLRDFPYLAFPEGCGGNLRDGGPTESVRAYQIFYQKLRDSGSQFLGISWLIWGHPRFLFEACNIDNHRVMKVPTVWWCCWWWWRWERQLLKCIVPSGELTFCHGKSTFLIWENPLFLWPFSIAMLVHQRVNLHFPIWFSYGFPIKTSIFLWFSNNGR